MKKKLQLAIVLLSMLTIGGIAGYIGGARSRNTQLDQLVQSLAYAHSAKETAVYTRLLEGLRDRKTELVTDRLEIMLDSSLTHIGTMSEFGAPPSDVEESVGRSLCLARNYRALHPRQPSTDWEAKRVAAALALTVDQK